ncbi:MAG: Gfo/Idh/MocA family oxidoreductase [Verrucomicrobia bacterium]|nr:Gfo/Idh/MocA family oxidoreductase [Verrucomicrobiota bacterium]MDA1087513.1 Gfo/Idh/MocA family oxidoreductase [Verrucomicrobiota bacterium]
MINVAIVGLGGIGNAHAQCYTANPHTKVVAVCDLIEERARKAGEAYGCPWFLSVKAMLKSAIRIDGVSVATAGKENGGDHYKPTMELLNAGHHVLGEKPISNEVPKAKRMVALAKRKRVRYGIDLNHRFTPAAIRAKEWIEKGRLGELNIINMTMWINNPNESSPHFHMRALHPHSIDVMRYFCGDVKKVQAFFKKGKGRKIWSNVQVNMQFANGIIGHLTGSYDAGGSYGLETCEIVGSEGRIVIREACESLEFYPRFSNEVETYAHLGGMGSFGDTFQSRINAWVEDLRKKTPPSKVDGKAEDALKAQIVIEAAIKSWEESKVVSV